MAGNLAAIAARYVNHTSSLEKAQPGTEISGLPSKFLAASGAK